MKAIAPFITILCLALFFATIGPIGQIKDYLSGLMVNNAGVLSGFILAGIVMSVMYFAVWVLRK